MTGALRLDRCSRCGTVRLTGRHACPSCGSIEHEVVAVPATGDVIAVSEVHRAPIESPVGTTPFHIALVAVGDVRLMGCSADALSIGDAVDVAAEGDGAPYRLRRR